MKPFQIHQVLDMTVKINEQGGKFHPLFVGPPGVGKSSVVQEWCRNKGWPFIDLRMAYLENVDMIGMPHIHIDSEREITKHFTPDFWPTEGKGVLLLEEPNRGTTSVTNCLMQLLTDRTLHKYTLPPGWIIVSCINPENEAHDVNVMDAALKNRFEIFEIDFDVTSFVTFARARGWDERLLMFVESGIFKYIPPEKIVENSGNKYVSPRSFEKLNNVLKVGVPRELELTIFQSILGDNYGRAFYSFIHDEVPVLFENLVNDYKSSIKRLGKYSDPKSYNNAQISITIKDIVKCDKDTAITDELLKTVILTIPADQAIALVKELSFSRNDEDLLKKLFKQSKEVEEHLKSRLKS